MLTTQTQPSLINPAVRLDTAGKHRIELRFKHLVTQIFFLGLDKSLLDGDIVLRLRLSNSNDHEEWRVPADMMIHFNTTRGLNDADPLVLFFSDVPHAMFGPRSSYINLSRIDKLDIEFKLTEPNPMMIETYAHTIRTIGRENEKYVIKDVLSF